MKKNVLLVILMSLIGYSVSKAQSSLLATLSHDDEVKVFYGAEALKNAHEAAVSGDVITLSSGLFEAVDIKKPITLRGAGMAMDTVYNIEPTVLSGDFSIYSSASDSINHLTMEGLYHNGVIKYDGYLYDAMFIKCRFLGITCFGNISDALKSTLKNASFLHCRIMDELCVNKYSSLTMVSCVVEDLADFRNLYSGNATIECTNCVIRNRGYKDYCYPKAAIYRNCIIISGNYINSGVLPYNCVGFGNSAMFKNSTNSTNAVVANLSDLFKTYTSDTHFGKLDSENFELNDEAKAKYLGLDGTQVGIYGGSLPFDPTPTNPQIVKCDVAAKSTSDGKLSVDIQVGPLNNKIERYAKTIIFVSALVALSYS